MNSRIKRMFRVVSVLLVLFPIVILSVTGCTENNRAKNWGGKQVIDLEANRKLVNATWKDSAMWILTKDMTSNDVAESYKFSEKSSFGMLEGVVEIKEKR